MKKMMKRIFGIFLSLVMVLSLFACGGNNSTTGNNQSGNTGETDANGREHVTLILYTQDTIQPGNDEKFAAVNEYLKEKLNVTIDFRVSSDYTSTMATRIDAGDEWDICLAGHGVDFQSYAKRNAFAPITEYLDLLPQTMAQLNQTGLSSFTIDDEVYAIPILKDAFNRNNATINQTLLDDLGLEFPEWATKRDLVDFFYELKEARDEKYPEDEDYPLVQDIFYDYDQWIVSDRIVGGWSKPLVDVNIDEVNGYKGIELNTTAFCPIYTPEYREIMQTVRDLVVEGVGAFDPKTFDADNVLLNEGKLLGTFGSGLLDVPEDLYPNFKSEFYPSTVIYAGSYSFGFAINAKCENVERAVEVIELMQNDTYIATTLHFGKEGSGWTDADNDGVIELTEKNSDPSNRWCYSWYGWSLGGVTSMKPIPGLSSDYFEEMKELNTTAEPMDNAGFIFNKEPVENQLAAVSNVFAEYHSVLQTGQNANVDELVDEFIVQLKANGMDEIVEEAQRQLDAWRAENGK